MSVWLLILMLAGDTRTGSLAQAEIAFSNHSEKHGMAEAFLTFLAKDALLLRPNGHVNGHELYRVQKPGGTLIWQPEKVVVSAAGDMGYSTGPYRFERPAHADDEEPPEPGYGRFVSVWVKNDDGRWEVIYDGGIFHGSMPRKVWPKPVTATLIKRFPQNDDFSQTRDAFFKLAGEKGLSQAFTQHGAPETRLYSPGRKPSLSLADTVPRIKPGTAGFTVDGGGMSRSGDLAYAYGTQKAKAGKDKGYLSIWQRLENGDWRLVLHLVNPRI